MRYLLCGNVFSLVMFIAVLPLCYLDLVHDVEHTVSVKVSYVVEF